MDGIVMEAEEERIARDRTETLGNRGTTGDAATPVCPCSPEPRCVAHSRTPCHTVHIEVPGARRWWSMDEGGGVDAGDE